MAFESEAPDSVGEGVATTATKNPMINPGNEDEGHPQMDTQLEPIGGGNNHNDNEV
jgi:hypothetical protein